MITLLTRNLVRALMGVAAEFLLAELIPRIKVHAPMYVGTSACTSIRNLRKN